MFKNKWLMIGSILVFGVSTYFYFQWRVPEGVQPMGDDTTVQSWVALVTAIVSLLTAIVGLANTMIQLRSNSSD